MARRRPPPTICRFGRDRNTGTDLFFVVVVVGFVFHRFDEHKEPPTYRDGNVGNGPVWQTHNPVSVYELFLYRVPRCPFSLHGLCDETDTTTTTTTTTTTWNTCAGASTKWCRARRAAGRRCRRTVCAWTSTWAARRAPSTWPCAPAASGTPRDRTPPTTGSWRPWSSGAGTARPRRTRSAMTATAVAALSSRAAAVSPCAGRELSSWPSAIVLSFWARGGTHCSSPRFVRFFTSTTTFRVGQIFKASRRFVRTTEGALGFFRLKSRSTRNKRQKPRIIFLISSLEFPRVLRRKVSWRSWVK